MSGESCRSSACDGERSDQIPRDLPQRPIPTPTQLDELSLELRRERRLGRCGFFLPTGSMMNILPRGSHPDQRCPSNWSGPLQCAAER